MGERLTVTITAQDGASKTFTTIANSATKMGDAVERAGKEGATGLKQVDAQAKTTGGSLDNLTTKATAVGGALGIMGSAIIALGSAHRDEQRQIDGINRLYGEQADQILAVSERIQDQTRYTNDAARESFLLASSLVGNYQLSTENLEVLIERSADLAQIYGFTLPDAMQRTSSALRSEGESAERLGLNMSDAAIAAAALDAGITNWNVPGALTEAEKAAFRFQVFLEQTENTVGAAAEAADNAGGSFRQFANDIQDTAQAFGGFLGPVGEVGAEMAPIAIALPVVSAGIGRFGAVLKTTGVAARGASLGMGALALVTSPLGLALAGVATASLLVYKYFDNLDDRAQNLAQSIGVLVDQVEELRLGGEIPLADQLEVTLDSVRSLIDELSGSDMSEVIQNLGLPADTTFLDISAPGGLNDQLAAASDMVDQFAGKVTQTVEKLGPEAASAYLDWVNQLLLTVEHTAEGTNLDEILTQIITTPASEVPGVMDAVTDSVTETNQALAVMAAIAPTVGAGLANIGTEAGRLGPIFAEAAAAAGEMASEGATAIVAFTDATQGFLENGDNILDFWLQYQEQVKAATVASFEQTESMEKGAVALADTVSPMEDAFAVIVTMARDLDSAGDALDSVLNTFRQIDDIGQRSAAAGSIADNLIGEPGALGTLQDLWSRINAGTADAALTVDTYNEAIAAGVSIQESNLRVQDDLTAMRAAQLPLLEQEQLAYEAQIDAISQLPALEQRRALAMQDSAVQAQLATAYSTAYSASLGEIPEDVATNMIVSAAEADPVIRDLLLQFGLIEEGADGTITVNFPDGPTVQESILMLTDSIDALTIAMGGVPPLRIEGDASGALEAAYAAEAAIGDVDGDSALVTVSGNNQDALGKIAEAARALGGLDGDSATVNLYANNFVSGAVSAAQQAINSLRGTTVTNYVRTVGLSESQRHGGIPGFAHGGVLFEGGEAGAEVAHFAGGGTAILPTHGLYTAPPMTYISPANANPTATITAPQGNGDVHLHVYGNVYGIDDLAGALEGAITQRRRGYGAGVTS